MKNVISILLGVLFLALTGCGQNLNKNNANAASGANQINLEKDFQEVFIMTVTTMLFQTKNQSLTRAKPRWSGIADKRPVFFSNQLCN
jgi:hypothetical protein